MLCNGTSWYSFVFNKLSKDGTVTSRIWLQSYNNEINPILYLRSSLWPHHRLKVSCIPVSCSIHSWWGDFFVCLVYVRTKVCVTRPCLFYHFRAIIALVLGNRFHSWRKNKSAKIFPVGVDNVKSWKERSWDEMVYYFAHRQWFNLTTYGSASC